MRQYRHRRISMSWTIRLLNQYSWAGRSIVETPCLIVLWSRPNYPLQHFRPSLNWGTPLTPWQAANRFPELWHINLALPAAHSPTHSQQLLGNYFIPKCIWSDLITCHISFCCLSGNTKQIDLLTFGGNIFWQVEGGMTLVSCWLVQCLQCRQLQCYQCLILLPVVYYFYLVLVGTLLFALATASQQAAVVGRWLKPIERQHKRRCHTSSSSHFIYHNLLQHPLQYNDLTNIIITMLSNIFQSTKSRRFCAQFQNTHKTGL